MRKTFKVWTNVFRRIHYFSKMYPLSSIIKDIFLFPLDYLHDGHQINTVRNVTFAITHKCNLRCQMCYFHKELANRSELPFSLYKKVIDEIARTHPAVILSGGEPFTHPDLVKMVAYAKSKNLPVQIVTNGTMLKPETIDELVSLKLDYINFSLLGNEVSHPLIAQVPNSYEKFVQNLSYFAEHRGSTKIGVSFTITPEGLKDIEHAVTLANRYKVDGVRFQHFNFLLPAEFEAQAKVMEKSFSQPGSVNEIELPPEMPGMAQDLERLSQEISNKLPGIPVQWAPTLTSSEIHNWYSTDRFDTQRKCIFPWRGIIIDANGKVYPCSKIYYELGDLNEGDILSIWNGKNMKQFRKLLRKGLFPACSRCCKL